VILAALAAAAALPLGLPPIAERTPNLYRQPSYCRSVVEQEAARQRTAFKGQAPAAQYALQRRLDGCEVPTPVGYHPNYLAPATANPAAAKPEAPASDKR
jgi:hypothetical protein